MTTLLLDVKLLDGEDVKTGVSKTKKIIINES